MLPQEYLCVCMCGCVCVWVGVCVWVWVCASINSHWTIISWKLDIVVLSIRFVNLHSYIPAWVLEIGDTVICITLPLELPCGSNHSRVDSPGMLGLVHMRTIFPPSTTVFPKGVEISGWTNPTGREGMGVNTLHTDTWSLTHLLGILFLLPPILLQNKKHQFLFQVHP